MKRRFFLLTLLAPLAALALAGCPAASGGAGAGGGARANLAGRKIRVTTTVGMVADIVRNVGGDRVEVTALMGPGIDPHYYKATSGDVSALNRADIIFYNGLELEGKMGEIFERIARNKPTVAVSSTVDRANLRQPREFQGRYDPHIWFDVTLWQQASRAVENTLAEQDPGSADVYRKNAEAYRKTLGELHDYVKKQIASLPPTARVLITAHDAFGYFGKQYGVEVRGLQGTSTTAEAGVRDVQELSRLIAERKIKAIFVESSVPRASIEAVQAAVRARGWQVAIGGQLFSDAMGAEGTPEGTYVGMVRHNVDTIVKALK
jgi:manganese/zinc/iron transport system substrate-binding protein